ncbi:hypothetical protein Ciccas_008223, partial [Cichlidogyrus casuarinus]
RERCSHKNCKYYHPPRHVAEHILKKGHESKKMVPAPQMNVFGLMGQCPFSLLASRSTDHLVSR